MAFGTVLFIPMEAIAVNGTNTEERRSGAPMRGRTAAVHIALIGVDAFAAVTAAGGGFALATGAEGERFPAEWLQGTPFRGYVIPGPLLAEVVGGSATVAAAATLRGPRAGGQASCWPVWL